MMKRIRTVLLVLLVVGATGLPALTTPAQAHTATCAGTFWLQMDNKAFGFPVVSPTAASSFTLRPNWATCADITFGVGFGSIVGHCESATGYGTVEGHGFVVTWTPGTMTFTGAVTGVVQSFVDPFVYDNRCNEAHAWHVLLTGALSLQH